MVNEVYVNFFLLYYKLIYFLNCSRWRSGNYIVVKLQEIPYIRGNRFLLNRVLVNLLRIKIVYFNLFVLMFISESHCTCWSTVIPKYFVSHSIFRTQLFRFISISLGMPQYDYQKLRTLFRLRLKIKCFLRPSF